MTANVAALGALVRSASRDLLHRVSSRGELGGGLGTGRPNGPKGVGILGPGSGAGGAPDALALTRTLSSRSLDSFPDVFGGGRGGEEAGKVQGGEHGHDGGGGGGGTGTGTGTGPFSRPRMGSPDLEDAGVDALRALKASNPDLMGMVAKIAKAASQQNLAAVGGERCILKTRKNITRWI